MRYDHERVAGHAVQLGQDARRSGERLGNDGDGRDPLLLEVDGVEHTARRATPSVADGGDDRRTLGGKERGVLRPRGRARIRLGDARETHELSEAQGAP